MNNKPDFGRDRFEGQMNPSERELLYNLVLQEKTSETRKFNFGIR